LVNGLLVLHFSSFLVSEKNVSFIEMTGDDWACDWFFDHSGRLCFSVLEDLVEVGDRYVVRQILGYVMSMPTLSTVELRLSERQSTGHPINRTKKKDFFVLKI